MFRKIVCIMSLMGMILMLSLSVYAADYWESEIPVVLYKIGSVTAEGYQITDGLANWTISRQEVESNDFLQWVLAQPHEDGQVFYLTGAEIDIGMYVEEGLYLVMPETQNRQFAPFLVTLSSTSAESARLSYEHFGWYDPPKTGDYPAPIFAAMTLSLAVAVVMILAENRRK